LGRLKGTLKGVGSLCFGADYVVTTRTKTVDPFNPPLTLLERIIEESKESYYESLRASSQGWHDGRHDLSPWRDYFLGTVAAAYRELERRAELATATPGAKRNLIREAVEHFVAEFTSKELELACPMVSREMIRVVLREMQAEGRVEKVGEGKGSRWKRIP